MNLAPYRVIALVGLALCQSLAAAETQTQTFTTGLPNLDLSTSFEPGSFDYADASATITGLPQFDPALGTLTDVIVDFQWSFNTDIFISAEGILDPGIPHFRGRLY